MLGKEGYCLKLARDGHVAMEIIDTQPPPSLVLLDLMIPIHSGFEILRHLRELAGWQHDP